MATPLTANVPVRYSPSARDRVLESIETLALPHGREDSFKLETGRLLGDRLLLGVPRRAFPAIQLEALAMELGMPRAAWDVLAQRLPLANAVFFGTEDIGNEGMLKVYLEFFDDVRQGVRAGDRAPKLLHLGVKWNTDRPDRFEEARYVCHPLLSVRDILRRMAGCYPEGSDITGRELARDIVLRAAHRAPDASFLYLEVEETGNPRRSFDINLYQSGLTVADAGQELRGMASHLGVPAAELERELAVLGPLPLGHISGGRNRRGGEFLSVYAEIAPLPAD